MKNEEYLQISFELEKHHALFNRLWSIGKPIFDNVTPTAGIEFDKKGEAAVFHINEEYWNTVTHKQKLFITSHECMHIFLQHGMRSKLIQKDKIKMEQANIAMDIVVNEMLVENFGFNRKEIDPENKYCWADTVFKGKNVSTKETFEIYYNMLLKENYAGKAKLVDSHDFYQSFLNEKFSEKIKGELFNGDVDKKMKDIIEKEIQDIEKEIEKMKDESKDGGEKAGQLAGTMAGQTWYKVKIGCVPKKRKWETVITRWAHKYIHDKEIEQWARVNRRFATIKNGLIIPSQMETEDYDFNKILVWFFQDTSGSCYGYADRFFKAALSLPDDKFSVRLFCFDTQVYETSLKTKELRGFGGTSFACIENYIQIEMSKKKLQYPKAIFIITDGYGDNVHPQIPRNWYWFLTENYRYCIPKESNVYMLKDYE